MRPGVTGGALRRLIAGELTGVRPGAATVPPAPPAPPSPAPPGPAPPPGYASSSPYDLASSYDPVGVRAGGERREDGERCEVCAAAVAAEHRHLLEVAGRELRCACRACAVLFDRAAAGPGGEARYVLVPDRRWLVEGFVLDDATWAELSIPVRMAFVVEDSATGRAVLVYPSPGGPVESPLEEATWERLRRANPVLRGLATDVEALLVNRTGTVREHWIVPVDDCYALVGLLRTRWKGLAGGPEVWREISSFFTGLRRRSRIVPPADDALGRGKGMA
ncbi:DUF5947 family protein [Nonomuraea glycinis]|uniref:Uncharacterized protein n=1 Tax=Nonomuraea glycinis TaxID=2047744 RepID=A0A918E6Y0_9ACTN|nr:DUF5947 family protein [Nonomuraea glycinis]MCA2177537.1 DUF5947 family protein [Nonomuraea glycinis]GGP09506.1 hypothetical protein GCM10012278_45470 [Nonomuraea glycinis]